MADTTARGRFVWHELITPNAAGAHEFYSKAVGWQQQPWEEDKSYSMFVTSAGPLGAAVENRSAVPHWLAYIGVPSVDAAVATALRLGAKVLTPPTDIPNAGRHASLTDPQGGAFAVHSSTMTPSPERAPSHGEFSWHELATTVDPTQVFPFYAELFGWEEMVRHDMGAPMGTYLIFGRNGAQLGGIFNKGTMGRPGPAYWLSYVSVPNIDSAVEQAKAGRGAVLHGPADVPGGDKIAQLMDPHGAFFAMHWSATTPAAKAAAKPAAKKPVAKPAAKLAAKVAPKAAKKKKAKTLAKNAKNAKKAAKKAGKKAAKKTAKRVAKKKAAKPQRKAAKKARGKRR
jgi:predicted enzyme related to lactoylglutathione lyase